MDGMFLDSVWRVVDQLPNPVCAMHFVEYDGIRGYEICQVIIRQQTNVIGTRKLRTAF